MLEYQHSPLYIRIDKQPTRICGGDKKVAYRPEFVKAGWVFIKFRGVNNGGRC